VTAITMHSLAVPAIDHLVERAASGDGRAFDELTEAFLAPSLRLAQAILRSEADARDAVQDAFIAAWRDLPRLRERDRFEPWLTRIVVNRCRSALRHRRVVGVREISLEPPRDGEAGGAQLGARRDARSPADHDAVAEADAIRRAFARLKPDARILIVLHHLEDRPVAEIAAVLGIPQGTVKWRLHAARAALEQALEVESR
jgi:RNA polymerase sigma-70 factor (ECF subfamily)